MQEKPSFAQRLATLRSARKLNQVELAEATGLGKTTINKWENGETEPVLSSIRRLAEFFSCTTDYLCGVSDFPTPYPSGFWMVDLDDFEKCLRGEADPSGSWACPFPPRVRIVDSVEVDRMERQVKEAPLPKRRRRGQ